MGKLRDLTLEELLGYVKISGSLMENGEIRIRMIREGSEGGDGCIITIMSSDDVGWQDSHYHESFKETYIVQEGWIAYAVLLDGRLDIDMRYAGENFTTCESVAHNVYMSAGAVIYTIKHGDCTAEKDWHAVPKLDELVKGMTEDDIHNFISATLQKELAELLPDSDEESMVG